ncbi:hypothetical protein QYF61_020737 [Mycteria americana]|uniref:Uncharacterized protein n=1 Tax=Mycteria americana TaxID=33587 RepID=A0AAN7NUC8_MYCAM|nr:hypothetical protein QYF61_020737 [Mycteria americana]
MGRAALNPLITQPVSMFGIAPTHVQDLIFVLVELHEAKQPQFPQPLLRRLLLQTLHQLRCPSLDTLQHLHVSLVARGPKLNTVFEVRPHQCRVQGHDHFPTPAGHAIFDTSQDAIGFLGRLGTLLTHIQAAVNQHSQVLFCRAAFQPLFPKPVALHGVAVTQVQDPALSLVESHTIGLSPSIQPVQVPLQSLPTLKQIKLHTHPSPPQSLTFTLLMIKTASLCKCLRERCDIKQFLLVLGWRLHHFPGQPLPMLDNPFGEEKFLNIQSKPPLAQLEAISSRPITCYLGEETDPHLSTTSFQAKQPQFPQPLLIRLLLQTLHQLRCPSLDTLQHLNIPLVVRGPKLNTVFEVQHHQCRVQGHDHFPSPAGHAISDTSQDAIGFLGRLGTLLAHIQAAVNQHSQVLLCRAAFQPLFPKPVALHGVAVTQVQDLALGLVKPHTIDLGPSIQPVQVPLRSLPTLKQINTPTQLGVICKLAEGALDPLIQIIDKDVKQNWPQY